MRKKMIGKGGKPGRDLVWGQGGITVRVSPKMVENRSGIVILSGREPVSGKSETILVAIGNAWERKTEKEYPPLIKRLRQLLRRQKYILYLEYKGLIREKQGGKVKKNTGYFRMAMAVGRGKRYNDRGGSRCFFVIAVFGAGCGTATTPPVRI
ncbi:MAG: hypothetical protein PHQ27_01340 [Victivallales bacterium]|nr:hypothetical protein [Victivallales bacterium]